MVWGPDGTTQNWLVCMYVALAFEAFVTRIYRGPLLGNLEDDLQYSYIISMMIS